MPRSVRLQYPGAYYHVMARGNRREAIFADDDDRRFFLHTLAQACEQTGWKVHAWVLMGNHYHLCLQTPEPNLVQGMSWLQNTYTRRYNVRHQLWGRLFGDRYKAIPVEGKDVQFYATLMDYIHLNPVRARLIKPGRGQSVLDFPWSSVAGGYALLPKDRAPWLAADEGLSAMGCADTPTGRRQFVERLDRRAVQEELSKCGVPEMPEEVDARCSHLRRGWYWGSQAFAAGLMAVVERSLKKVKSYRSGGESRAHDEVAAIRLLEQGLKVAGLTEEMLPGLPGSDVRKVALARFLTEHTTVSQGWLAEKLHMKSASNVSQQLSRERGKSAATKLGKALRKLR